MLGLNDAAIFIIKTLGSLYLLIVLMRFILQLVRANFYNPLCQFIVKATQPLLKPLRRVIPSMFGLDMSSLVLALIIQMLLIAVILLLKGFMVDWLFLVPWALIALFSLFLNIIFWAMIISVILSWVAQGSHNPTAMLINQICEPLLSPIRRILPSMGGLDLSPIVAFLILNLIDMLVIRNLAIMTGMYKGLSLAI